MEGVNAPSISNKHSRIVSDLMLDWTFLNNGDLFDRHEEVEILQEAFRRRLSPRSLPELILLSGESGTGKTALAGTLEQSTVSRGGYFIVGKFDQLHNPQPYSAFVSAFSEFVTLVLARGHATVKKVKEAVLGSVGSDSRLLVEMIPALKLILGPQNPHEPVTLKGMESQARQQQIIFRNFIRAICSLELPLVLVMDDLQWADKISLDMLETIVSDRNNEGLVLLGICRSNEVSYHDHFALLLRQLEDEKRINITHIMINNLTAEASCQMISSAMNIPQKECQSLAYMLFEKTRGNPLSLVQLLQLLYNEKLLHYNKIQSCWEWEETKLRSFQKDTDVIDWVSLRISQFPENVQIVLKTAACLGSKIDKDLLSAALTNVDVTKALYIAIDQGIIAYNKTYNRFVFCHDKVHQAIYALIPQDEKELVHLSIGRRLWHNLEKEDMIKNIYVVVVQMLSGASLLDDQNEKDELASLCLKAGTMAMLSSDFKTASIHFWSGIRLLNKRWRDQHDLILQLHNAVAEAEYCNANFDKVDEAVSEVLSNARTFLDKIRAYSVQVYSLWARRHIRKAVDLGLYVLNQLGEKFPTRITFRNKVAAILGTKAILYKMSNDDVLQLPDMIDREKIASMSIMNLIAFYSFAIMPDLFVLVSTRMVRLSVKHGISAISAYGFGTYSVICGQMGDYNNAYRFGTLSLSILERYKSEEWVARVYSTFYGYIASWKQPIRSVLEYVYQAEITGMDTGDIEFSMLACRSYSLLAFVAGIPLPKIADKLGSDLEKMTRYKQNYTSVPTSFQLHMVKNFMGQTDNPLRLIDDGEGDEDEVLQLHMAQNDKKVVFQFMLWKMMLAYHFGKTDIALTMVKKILTLRLPRGWVIIISVYWYIGLIELAVACKTKKRLRQNKHIKRAKQYYEKLRILSRTSPMNCMHKVLLMETTIAAVQGKINLNDMYLKYDFAIALAGKKGFIQDQALGCELAAAMTTSLSEKNIQATRAKRYFETSVALYNEWGAKGKVDHMMMMSNWKGSTTTTAPKINKNNDDDLSSLSCSIDFTGVSTTLSSTYLGRDDNVGSLLLKPNRNIDDETLR